MSVNATGESAEPVPGSADGLTSTDTAFESESVPSNRIVIEATHGWRSLRLGNVWEYRELVFFFVWRDVKVRYKQTVLGVFWAVVQPLALLAIFTLVLGRLAGLSKQTPDGVPYPALVFAGLVPWTLFASALKAVSQSVVGNVNLVTKVYFPRLVLPLASAGSYVIDFVLSGVILLALMAYYGIYPDWRIVALPGVALLALVSAVGVGTWLTALNVRYRDVQYIVPFVTQIWLFASPVAYSSTQVPERYRVLYDLNPMAGCVEGFRWALLGKPWVLGWLPAISVVVSILVLVSGAFFFRRVERTFADEV